MSNIAVMPSSLLRAIEMLCAALRDPHQTTHLNSLLSREFFQRVDQAIVRKRSQGNHSSMKIGNVNNRPMKIGKHASAIQLCATAIVKNVLKWSTDVEHSLGSIAFWKENSETI